MTIVGPTITPLRMPTMRPPTETAPSEKCLCVRPDQVTSVAEAVAAAPVDSLDSPEAGESMIVLRLKAGDFGRSELVCTGDDLADVVNHVSAVYPNVQWYIAGVSHYGAEWPVDPFARPQPVLLGETTETASRLRTRFQFQWAALAATVDASVRLAIPSNEMYGDEQPDRPLGNALLYVRAFDASYVEIVTADKALLDRFVDAYGRHIIAYDFTDE